ncbi:MAG: D-alanyl-D-alanine carboxypeptidase [Oscillospiraceae bacterium]|nr:D-alanyl-D-alanine carboxypeptidase [Oscillospiraceae bacterium]
MDYTDTEDVDLSVFAETSVPALGENLEISAPSAILIEKETGTVIYEKEADMVLEPASVTKVMTILLIVEAIERGDLSLGEMITCSARASSMGGSQVYLKEGEQLTLHDMLKSIVVSSANDAAVAVAEHMCGSEAGFVSMMNNRASGLGMTNTNFNNCTGLMDDPEHVTTARDIAIMSRELISHDMIKEYTTIWTDTIRGGEFGLSNTNKLIRYYIGATGLKTGFTNRSMYCLSATAQRDGVEYIAVIMHGETSAQRFEDAKTLLSYGFANYTLADTAPADILPPIPVILGKTETVQPVAADARKLLVEKSDAGDIRCDIDLCTEISAPVCAGDKLGTATVYCGDEVIYTYNLEAADNVPKLSFFDIFLKCLSIVYKNSL